MPLCAEMVFSDLQALLIPLLGLWSFIKSVVFGKPLVLCISVNVCVCL